MTPEFACDCEDCRKTCSHKPGWFLPGEVETLAANLDTTVKELFATKLAIDWWEETPNLSTTFVLSPAIVGEDTGTEFPGNPEGRCVFFDDGKCSIHEKGKPFECAALTHEPRKERHLETARAWTEYQEQIHALLGRAPETTEYTPSIFDSFFRY